MWDNGRNGCTKMFEASTQREGGPAEEDGIMWKGRGLTRKLLVETDLFSSEIFRVVNFELF